jgi:hypothetical protein
MRISSFLSRRVLRAREDCGDGRRRAVPYCVVNVCCEAFTNCCPVSTGIVRGFVLVLDLQSQSSRRTQACQRRGSRLDPTSGCRESDLGGAAHSR